MQPIILASQSKNRQDLLRELNIPFTIVPSRIDEQKISESDPAARAQQIARAKAEFVAKKNSGIIIAADTFTVCRGRLMEKPKNLTGAKEMLNHISGSNAVSYTGFCYLNTVDDYKFIDTATTAIKFRKLYEQEIEQYLRVFPVTTWAAAYAVSELYLFSIIDNISGSLAGFTHGLPTEFLIPLLAKEGYHPTPKKT